MQAVIQSLLPGLLFLVLALDSFASYVPGASFISEEYDNFYLYYRANSAYGEPVVEGNTVFFLPDAMSVEGWRRDSGSWTTTIAIQPKEGFDINSITLTENGVYTYTQSNTDNEGIFDVNTSFFIRDQFSPGEHEFLRLDESLTASDDVDFEHWSVSGSFDTSEFSGGFYLTIKNSLHIKGDRRMPVPAQTDWLSQWQTDREHLLNFLKEDHDGFLQKVKGELGSQGFGQVSKDYLFMQKNYIGIEIITSEIPLPPAAWLFASALGLMVVVMRRA